MFPAHSIGGSVSVARGRRSCGMPLWRRVTAVASRQSTPRGATAGDGRSR